MASELSTRHKSHILTDQRLSNASANAATVKFRCGQMFVRFTAASPIWRRCPACCRRGCLQNSFWTGGGGRCVLKETVGKMDRTMVSGFGFDGCLMMFWFFRWWNGGNYGRLLRRNYVKMFGVLTLKMSSIFWETLFQSNIQSII